jgi:hypothetical protein
MALVVSGQRNYAEPNGVMKSYTSVIEGDADIGLYSG